MNKLPRAIFISGTDTAVGKTVATSMLASLFDLKGLNVGVIKPFQTGIELDETTDIEFVYKFINKSYDIDETSPLRLKKPLSPLSAAQFEKKKISVDEILNKTVDYVNRNDITLIEGAGGLYVPIKSDYMVADFAHALGFPLIIVTRPGLGTINHTLLSVEYAKNIGLDLLGIVVNNFPIDPDFTSIDNLKSFKSVFNLNIVGVIPAIENLNVESCSFIDSSFNPSAYFSKTLGGEFVYEQFLNGM